MVRMGGTARAASMSAPPDALYIAATAATVLLAVYLPATAGTRSMLSGPGAVWQLPLLLIPAFIGWALMRSMRRLWAWPYAYLAALALALRGARGNDVDQAYAYAGEVVILLAILLAEVLGLSLGRWLHRAAALAYFAAAGLWQLSEAARSVYTGPGGIWHAATLSCGGVLFMAQSAVQYVRYRRQAAAEAAAAALQGPAELPAGEPWVIRKGEADAQPAEPPAPPDKTTSAGATGKSEMMHGMAPDHPAAGLVTPESVAPPRDKGGRR